MKTILRKTNHKAYAYGYPILVIIFFLISFKQHVIGLFDTYIVEKYLIHINQSIFLDLAFLFILLYTVYFTIISINYRRYFYQPSVLLSSAIALLSIIAHFQTRYILLPLATSPNIYYTDILICSLSIPLIKIITAYNKKPTTNLHTDPFLIDIPIEGNRNTLQDTFGYKPFAVKLAKKIQSKQDSNYSGSIAIGIIGQWGSGKTSFINLVQNEINHEKNIVISFNPWSSHGPEQIIEDFFKILSNRLKLSSPILARNLNKYAENLSEFSPLKKYNHVTSFINLFSINKYNNVNYTHINKLLKFIDRNIIIFIDDLDRLDKKEIIEVLRLIRNTANFYKTIFVVTYDKSYIEEAIKDMNPYNSNFYLDKIFQYELVLPYLDPELIKNNLISIINQNIDKSLIKTFTYALNLKIGQSYLVNELIKNQRDVNRFSNSLTFDYSFVQNEVHPVDFMLLQLLKWRFPKQYDLLRINRFIYLTISGQYRGLATYRLRKKGEESLSDSIISMKRSFKPSYSSDELFNANNETTIFDEHINNDNTLSQSDKILINHIVNSLFDQTNKDNQVNFDFYNSIIFPHKFSSYFKLALNTFELPTKQFQHSRAGSFDNYVKYVEILIDENKLQSFIERLFLIENFKTIREFENHVNILGYLGNRFYHIDNTTKFPIFLLCRAIYLANDQLKIYKTKGKLIKFIKDFLTNASSNLYLLTDLIAMLIRGEIDILITKNELININLAHFKSTLKRNVFDKLTTIIYNNCIIHDRSIINDKYIISPEATKLYILFVKNNIQSCQLHLFIKLYESESLQYQLNIDEVEFFFDSYSNFINYLAKAPNINKSSDCYLEFINFLNILKYDNNNNKPVSFEFKQLVNKNLDTQTTTQIT